MENLERNEVLKRPWDTCREVPIIEDEHTPWKFLKLLKIITLVAVAIIVFGLAICSKVSFLLLITLSHEDTKTIPAEQKPVTLLCIGCALIAPSVLLLFKSIWKGCYKSSKVPKKASVALVLFFELLVSVGLAILTIVAMPHLDIVTNVTILNGVAVLPAFFQAVAQCTAKKINVSLLPSILGVLAILTAFCVFLVLYILKDLTDVQTATWVGLAVGGCFFVSFNWWENYFMLICVNSKSKFLKSLFEDLTKCQNMLHILSSLLRIVVTACVLGAYVPLANMDWDIVTSIPSRETRIVVITIGVQLISSALCHWFALAAFKMHAIRRCFIIPLYLASLAVMVFYIVPVIVYFEEYKLSLNTTENINFTSYCAVAVNGRNLSLIGNLYPELVLDVTQTLCFLNMSEIVDIGLLTGAAAAWWFGLVLATIHIWFFNVKRIQKTQDFFIRRLYEGAFIEQSLLLNTRFQIQTKKGMKKQYKEENIPAMVYLCATMWHETYEEMMNIMISIFRLDKYRPKIDPKFNDFTFEAHIYFDDAFERVGRDQDPDLNPYAKDLVRIITEVYGIFKNLDKTFFEVQQQIPDQAIIETPYGARLVFEMPHGNYIIVHFKDKEKIRKKKRWSQIMYLYYLLGWKLMAKYHRRWKLGCNEKDVIKDLEREKHNTYLLALDGDTDFQPASVMLLIDRLKMYRGVGAACGRIHPTGSGPAVWFQKFEYAVSHWLQKTAEHVYGCVLCSPGCFSLYRAEALMDDNVMKTYATKSTEPSHYIQYDQGEDRWLCTLLLKQGWRVEYNAASDAYTNAPQDFKELFNQRRRWGPSTMANIIDLLGSTNIVSKRNTSMSKPFMLYLLFILVSSIVSPSTIVLMIAGSLAFLLEIHYAAALVIAVIPPAIYLGLCYKLKTDTQITIAAVMSVIYAFLMLVVVMSIIGSMVRDQTILTPSSTFIVAMSIIYVVTALMHPQEFLLVFYGLLYILCIPSAYLLLIIYAMVNMNCVSWGTREAKPAAGAETTGTNVQQSHSERAKTTWKKFCSWMKCCKKSNQTSEVEEISIRQENLDPEPTTPEPQPQNTLIDDVLENEQDLEEIACDSPVQSWKRKLESLSTDIQLQEASLDEDEEQFWNELIEKYLSPLKEDKEKQEEIKNDLRELRNKVTFSFFFLNALWLVAAFILQVFDVFVIKIESVNMNLEPTGGKFQIEPLSLLFIVGFALSVAIQFFGMFYHRVATLIHYVAFLETDPKQQKLAEKKDLTCSASSESGLTNSVDLSNITDEIQEETWNSDTDFSELDFGEQNEEL
ncbi:chitin synthase chs-2-like isoform X1 [Cyprinodon tularosa]|uniref:chitin synthase chs-2-like isoform X1 n=1 Tax=Cyprinodon tularosa TaxID=77115 RepID=UPI0018E24B2D|nr:chitin synthase chs-2-like isoform X1 [Cyprinodon tularosa]